MDKNTQKPILLLVCFALVLFAVNSTAQEALEKKFAVVAGDYEFDMSDMGMGIMLVSFYVEDGAFWALTETSSEPGKMEPVEGKELEFTIEDEDGTFLIKFLKDDQGKYTKCQVINEAQGIDITGTKVEK